MLVAPEIQEFSPVIMTMPDKRVIVVSDVHIPFFSYRVLLSMLRDIRVHKVSCVVWAGDLVDNFYLRNVLPPGSQAKLLEVTRRVIRLTAKILGPYGCQVISRGYHDSRWRREYATLTELYQACGLDAMLEDGSLFISELATVKAVETSWFGKLAPEWEISHPYHVWTPSGYSILIERSDPIHRYLPQNVNHINRLG